MAYLAVCSGSRFTNDFFARNSTSMKTSLFCNSVDGHQIAIVLHMPRQHNCRAMYKMF